MDSVPHKLIGPLEQLGCDNDHRGCTVSHLLVLQLCQLHQDLQGFRHDLRRDTLLLHVEGMIG